MRKHWAKIALFLALMLLTVCSKLFLQARLHAKLHTCQTNQKILALALEEYNIQFHRYPARLEQVVPRFLRNLPTCPAAGRDTYSQSYQVQLEEDYFQFCCQNQGHTYDGFPQYDGGLGLLVVPPALLEIELPPEPAVLAVNDIEYGRSEVDKMMRDRPAMAQVVQRGDVVYEWTARRFGGLGLGQRTYWFGGSFIPDLRSSCIRPRSGWTAQIAIAQAIRHRDLTGQQQWYDAVFQLHSIATTKFADALDERANRGLLSRQQYIGSVLRE